MVQQQVKSVWQHMVGVMCLNMTHRKQVKKVLPILFKKYPNAKAFLQGKSEDQERLLQPLGMVHVRTQRLRRMSEDFLKWDRKDATDLYGIGKYGSDSYRIFCNYHYHTFLYHTNLVRLYNPMLKNLHSFV